jgi:hypothetical protein
MRGPNRPKIKDQTPASSTTTSPTFGEADDLQHQRQTDKSPRLPPSSPPTTAGSQGRKRAPTLPSSRSPLGAGADDKTSDREREQRNREQKRPSLPLFVSAPRPGAARPPLPRHHHHARPSVVPMDPMAEGVFESGASAYGMGGMIQPAIAGTAGEGFGVGSGGYVYGPGFHPQQTRQQQQQQATAELMNSGMGDRQAELGPTTKWVDSRCRLEHRVLHCTTVWTTAFKTPRPVSNASSEIRRIRSTRAPAVRMASQATQ